MTEPAANGLQTTAERRAAGKAIRQRLPRQAQGQWLAGVGRGDPVGLLLETSKERIAELLPIRWERMKASPFTFLRGAAAVMARDLGSSPASGLKVQACGDCHLMNFGAFATAEGNALFDINDFDETLPASFEWDVKRLAASIAVAALDAGHGRRDGADMARAAVSAYRQRLRALAEMTPLEVWQDRVTIDGAVAKAIDGNFSGLLQHGAAEARHPDPIDPNFPRLTEIQGGRARFKDKPPLIRHFDTDHDGGSRLDVHAVFAAYRRCLQDDRRMLLDRYALVDTAIKVVGVGSVGTFCAIALLMTADGAPLILQIKEASESVLAPFAGASIYTNQGHRVVTGQRLIQGAVDPFLGWTEDGPGNRFFYIRRLKDRLLASLGELLERKALPDYAALCGRTLARAHGRSGDAAAIAGYLGKSDAFEDAVARFAQAYTEQTERDHQAFLAAIRAGRLPTA
jgi:uncharacterized protein (DUF2252 family)